MVAYTPHTHLTFGGTLSEVSGQDEVWQCGIRGINDVGNVPIDPSQLGDALDTFAPFIETWFTDAGSKIPQGVKLTWAKLVNVAADGHYSVGPQIHEYTGVQGAVSTYAAPSFLSVAMSFGTGRSFGKALRGRMYPPNFGAAFVPPGSTVDGTAVAAMLATAVTLLNSLNYDAPEWHFRPGIFSETGQHNRITNVRVGNVYDVQRRRKNAVPETYVSTDLD